MDKSSAQRGELAESRMRGNAHVRFGGRDEETGWAKAPHRASPRPYYLGVGTEEQKSALLCLVGAREDGTKELLALELGYRGSTQSWQDLLRDLRDRGLSAPLMAVADGGLGLWAALDEVFPTTEQQRCWNHRVLNLQDKLPNRLHAEARRRLHAMWEAETQAECARLRDAYVSDLRVMGQGAAAETQLRDWADFVRFYHFPREHWVHLRTSNPVELIFAGVRLRTNAAKRVRQREAALYLVFKAITRLSRNWRALNGGRNLMALVLEDCIFQDGLRKGWATPPPTATTAA